MIRGSNGVPIVLVTPEALKFRGGVQVLLGRLAQGWNSREPLKVLAPRGHRLDPSFLWSAWHQLEDLIRQGRCRALLCGHWTVGILGWWAKHRYGIPYTVWAHGLEVADRRWGFLQQRIFSQASLLFTTSHYTKELVQQRFGLPDAQVVPVWPGVDAARFGGGRPHSILQQWNLMGHPVLLTVGRLSRLQRYKGIDTTLRALPAVLQRMPKTYYLIVGQMKDDAAYLQRLASSLGVAHAVRFAGEVPEPVLPDYYAACDLFIMPTRTEIASHGMRMEGFGMAFLEAAAARRPAIGGRSGGVPEAVVDGVTGLLVDPTDICAVSDGILQLLSDPGCAERLGTQACTRAASQFTWARTVQQVQTHLEALVP